MLALPMPLEHTYLHRCDIYVLMTPVCVRMTPVCVRMTPVCVDVTTLGFPGNTYRMGLITAGVS